MEMLLQELASSSKLLRDFKEMYEYENRLKTFTNWPFAKNCKCTPENVSLKTDILTTSYSWCTILNIKLLLSVFMFKKSCRPVLSCSGFTLLSSRTLPQQLSHFPSSEEEGKKKQK